METILCPALKPLFSTKVSIPRTFKKTAFTAFFKEKFKHCFYVCDRDLHEQVLTERWYSKGSSYVATFFKVTKPGSLSEICAPLYQDGWNACGAVGLMSSFENFEKEELLGFYISPIPGSDLFAAIHKKKKDSDASWFIIGRDGTEQTKDYTGEYVVLFKKQDSFVEQLFQKLFPKLYAYRRRTMVPVFYSN